ncbi:MAG TPA: hypothetical protein VKR52_02825 [Terracidiphilus sp.]|nr:hypothetical protein [Terracidiphilus sp.]
MMALPPKSNRQIVEETNRAGVQFLLADLVAALTFLDVADVTDDENTRTRNRHHARLAYETVLKLLPRISPSDEERPELESKLEDLKNRLLALGYLKDRCEIGAPGLDQSL